MRKSYAVSEEILNELIEANALLETMNKATAKGTDNLDVLQAAADARAAYDKVYHRALLEACEKGDFDRLAQPSISLYVRSGVFFWETEEPQPAPAV